MFNIRCLISSAVIAGACGACAAGVAPVDRLEAHSAPSDLANAPSVTTTTDDPGPPIDWDNPTHGIVVNGLADASKSGQLSFQPVTPKFSSSPVSTIVSDPMGVPAELRSITFVFHFPTSTANFPTDGRVIVTEQAAGTLTPTVLGQIAADHAASGEYQMVTVAGQPALLITGQGLGRVVMLLGAMRVSILGPGLSPTVAQDLASQLKQQVG